MSTFPNVVNTTSSNACTDANSDTSELIRSDRCPIASMSRAAASTMSARRPVGMTSAPASANPRLMARPIPDVPPTTTATLPLRSKPVYFTRASLRAIIDISRSKRECHAEPLRPCAEFCLDFSFENHAVLQGLHLGPTCSFAGEQDFRVALGQWISFEIANECCHSLAKFC